MRNTRKQFSKVSTIVKKILADFTTIDGACGVGVAYSFADDKYYNHPIDSRNPGGAGFLCAGFLNNDICQRAYQQLCAKYTLVYQSPVRINKNSDNDFYFCVFDTQEADVPHGWTEIERLGD